jgi:hypothetical protein
MTNDNNAIGIVKIQKQNYGHYLRIPNSAVRIMRLEKGDLVWVFVSRDKTSIRFVKVSDPNDIINLDDEPATELQRIPFEQAGPAAKHRLSELIHRITGK